MFINSLIAAVISLVLSWIFSLITRDESSTFGKHLKNGVLTLVSFIIVQMLFKTKGGVGYLNQQIKTGVPNF